MLSIRSATGYGGMVLLAWAIVWPYPAEALAGVLLAAPWLGLVLIAARDGRLNLYPKPMTIAEIEKGGGGCLPGSRDRAAACRWIHRRPSPG